MVTRKCMLMMNVTMTCLGATKHPKANCLGTRKYAGVDEKREYKKSSDGLPIRTTYVWDNFEQVDQQARAFGSGLIELGAKAKDNIGIWAVNRSEWVISSLGFYSQNMRTVSLYATLGDEAVQYIINHAEISIVVTEKDNVKKLISSIPKLAGLKTIIQFDPVELYGTAAEYVDEAHVKAASDAGVRLIAWSDVVKSGIAKAHFPVPPTEEDLAFVMYTSGTTGMPKGALLRHGNVMAAVAACPSIFNLREGQELHVSYLPLAHIFETVVQSAIFACGGAVGFFQGNVKKLTNDFIDLQPTILCGVPRVFSKIYQKVFQGVTEKNCMVKWYFNKAYTGQCDNLRNGRARDVKYDNKVFIPLRQRIGMGRCRIVITGAAPCPPYLLEFLRVITPGGIVVQ
jgi:long-chain acyl-CoA synthetase